MIDSETAPQDLFAAADAAVSGGDIDGAIVLFLEVARRAPDDSAAMVRAGHLLLRREWTSEALDVLADAVARHPGNITAWFLKGEAAERLGDFATAVEAYGEVTAMRPDLALAWSRLGATSRESGAVAAAIPAFRQASRLEPAAVGHHADLARVLYEARMTEEAVIAFRRQLLLAPGDTDGWYNIAVSLPLLGAREAGLDAFRRVVVLNPVSAGAWSRIGRLRRRLDRDATSEVTDRRAMVLAPGDPEPMLRRAEDESDQRIEGGIRHRLVCAAPENLRNRVIFAEILLAAGRFDATMDVLRSVVERPDPAEAAVNVYRQACEGAGSPIPSWCLSAYQRWLTAHGDAGWTEASPLPRDGTMISVIMPVCDPPVELLRQAIASVVSQTYPAWQLCIADDASVVPEVRALLDEAADDPRINVTFRAERGHISVASNTALASAGGDIVCFLDHDDLLAPDALASIAVAFNGRPDLQMVYSDEDKIDESGARFDPHFKPDWNLDLLLSQNYVCHLMAIRRSLVERLGGFTLGLEGSQDHDLALRVGEVSTPDQIKHIARVLYHWRATPGSTATGAEAKPYTVEATRRTLQAHHDRAGDAAVTRTVLNGWRTVYPLPESAPLVSIIVPTRDRLDLLRRCIEGARRGTRYPAIEILVVDNASREAATLSYLDQLRGSDDVRVLEDHGDFNFSRLNNSAVKAARGEILCFLNNDVEPLSPDWLDEMVAHALRPGVGVVGAKLLYPDRSIQHGGIILCGDHVARHLHVGLAEDAHGYWGRAAAVQSLAAVTGACMVVRREVFEVVGGFDEAFPVDFGDIDLCLRLGEAGYRTLWTPHAVLVHHESASRGTFITHVKQERYEAARAMMVDRWGGQLASDPHYNSNLSIRPEDKPFSLSFPPRRVMDHG